MLQLNPAFDSYIMYNLVYKHTPRICNTCFFFAATMLHECASILIYKHIDYFVLHSFGAQFTCSQLFQRNYLTNATVFLISNGL